MTNSRRSESSSRICSSQIWTAAGCGSRAGGRAAHPKIYNRKGIENNCRYVDFGGSADFRGGNGME